MKSKIVILFLFTFIILTNNIFPATLKILKREAPSGNIIHVPITISRAEKIKGTLFEIVFRVKSSAPIGGATDIFWIEANLFDEDTESIPVETEDGVIKVSEFSVFPNPFTPNDDGFNDHVNFIIPDSVASEVAIKIFGVKGNRVREISKSSDPILQWDGFDENNHLMQPGVYLYVILRNAKLMHKGTITLMR